MGDNPFDNEGNVLTTEYYEREPDIEDYVDDREDDEDEDDRELFSWYNR